MQEFSLRARVPKEKNEERTMVDFFGKHDEGSHGVTYQAWLQSLPFCNILLIHPENLNKKRSLKTLKLDFFLMFMKVLPHYIASSFPSTYASSPPEAKPVCSYFYQFTPNFQIVFLQQNTSISLGFVMHV